MPSGIPDFVVNDLNEETLKRYLTDPDFRRNLLSDPAATNTSSGLGFSQQTIDWINERVAHHGLENLLSAPRVEVPTA
jgi:hypothetical protein